jgi:cellulose synthase/poly-beta-1,6-N-acetylglucosamine synthase-like glycosyltransferase
MIAQLVLEAAQWLFLGYFLLLNGSYLALTASALVSLRRYLSGGNAAERVYARLEIPISLIVPAYNEESTIVASVRALLQLRYQQFEVIVVNDGSRDGTLAALTKEFALQPFPEAYRVQVRSKPVRGVYRSLTHPNLRVIDKENGGSKADASNAGLNAARYPLFYCGDADSVLDPDALRRAVRPFLEDPHTVACGGTVRIINGCRVRGGFLERVGLPRNPLALLQIVEYLRAFLGGRLGWAPLNGLLIISGAFGVFHRQTVIDAGGYRPEAIGEDMDLVVRLHRLLSARGQKYRIGFVPDPVCWTDAPEDLATLARQRKRWQRGLVDSLRYSRELCFARGSGAAGWIAYPFFVVFELFGPVVEVFGYAIMLIAYALGLLSLQSVLVFAAVAIGLGVLLSASSLLLEELSFHVYPRTRHLLVLFLVAIVENFGYRQLTAFWRVHALIDVMRGRHVAWGAMKRSVTWQEAERPHPNPLPRAGEGD